MTKGIDSQRAKPPTPTRAIEALIEDEEQNRKQKKKELNYKEKDQQNAIKKLNKKLLYNFNKAISARCHYVTMYQDVFFNIRLYLYLFTFLSTFYLHSFPYIIIILFVTPKNL